MSARKPASRPTGPSNPTITSAMKARLDRIAAAANPSPRTPTRAPPAPILRLCSHCNLPAANCPLLSSTTLTNANHPSNLIAPTSFILPLPLSAALATYRLGHHTISPADAATIVGDRQVDPEMARCVMECMVCFFPGYADEARAAHFGMAMAVLEGAVGGDEEELAEKAFARGWWIG